MRKETITDQELPVNVANIGPGTPAATKPAHLQRLKSELPAAQDFGAEYMGKYALRGVATHPIVSQRDKKKQEKPVTGGKTKVTVTSATSTEGAGVPQGALAKEA